MALPVVTQFATPPEGTCPTTFTDAVNVLNTLVSSQITTSYLPYIIGSTTPAVEDRDKAWVRLDSVGRPLGTFIFYAGSWRREYTGKAREITSFNGDPALYFDGTGKGLTTAEWDGWAICNGNNGTPNLTDKFISGAHMDGSGGQAARVADAWVSLYNGNAQAIGGTSGFLILPGHLPELALQLDGNEYNPGGSPHAEARAIIDTLYQNPSPHSVTIGHYGATGTNVGIPNIPPFYAMAFCMFIGYS